ncbi:MAG: hypothetical protein BA874_12780 [Desulfuromonadales bacterium C00003068]|jgi:hypothetical protein|nr:MAG: hypothetical protein BA874_12780 [Desulfuromonadales bacterium C00003068]
MIIQATNPKGQIVRYDPDLHVYHCEDLELTSVTKFLDQFFSPFDSLKIGTKYAVKHGKKLEEVLAGWKKEGDDSRDKGHLIHKYAEDRFNGTVDSRPGDYYRSVEDAKARLETKFRYLSAEQIVFSPRLQLAGTIDLLMVDPCTGEILILDWKIVKKIKDKNPWQIGLFPIQHLDACNFNKYSLQLNIYERILREEGYFPECRNFRKGLIHIKAKDLEWKKVKDMQGEVENMLKESDN